MIRPEPAARSFSLPVLWAACAHSAHGRHLYHWCMDKFGDMKFDMGDEILVDSPLYQTIMGTKPKSFKDFNEGLYYLEEEVVQLLAATHTGQEAAFIDFESKALHAGMLDLLGMEICDMLQIVAYDMPRGAADAPIIEIGMGTMDQNKGVLIAYGHNLAAGAEAMIYAEEQQPLGQGGHRRRLLHSSRSEPDWPGQRARPKVPRA